MLFNLEQFCARPGHCRPGRILLRAPGARGTAGTGSQGWTTQTWSSSLQWPGHPHHDGLATGRTGPWCSGKGQGRRELWLDPGGHTQSWGSTSAAAKAPGRLSGPAAPMGARTKFLPDLHVPSEYLTLWNILMAERQRDFFFFFNGNTITGSCRKLARSWKIKNCCFYF